MSFPRSTRAERETIIRFDEQQPTVDLSTASPVEANRWMALGYDVRVHGRYPDGSPRSWEAQAPRGAVRLRRVVDGELVRRPAPQHAFKAHPTRRAANDH
jgi:hypothetical protein